MTLPGEPGCRTNWVYDADEELLNLAGRKKSPRRPRCAARSNTPAGRPEGGAFTRTFRHMARP